MATISDQPPEPIDRRRLIISTVSSLLIFVLCLFLPAGTWMWSRGWLFIFVMVVASILITIYLRRVNPEVIAARVNRHEGTRRWDLLLGLIVFLPTMLAIPIVAALDDGRYHWLPRAVVGLRAGLCPPDHRDGGSDMGRVGEQVLRADRPNPDRPRAQGHRHWSLCHRPTSGIRFWPSLLFLGMPLALGSLWALIPAVLLCLLLVLRTILEDRTLRERIGGL